MHLRSENTNELVAALIKAKSEYPDFGKNKSGHFTYCDYQYMMKLAQPVLDKHGLNIDHQPWEEDGKELLYSIVTHTSGQFIASCIRLRSVDNNKADKFGGAITFFKRYAAMALLGINPTDDPSDDNGKGNFINAEQIAIIEEQFKGMPDRRKKFLEKYQLRNFGDIYVNEFEEVLAKIITVLGAK